MDDTFVRGILGPFGCVSGDTEIITEYGPRRIAELNRPVRVLSWNEKAGRFQLSLSGGGFPKDRDYLYRVSTRQGEFVAAGHHRVFCADCKYRQVQDLSPGQSLSRYSEDPSRSSFEGVLRSLRKDAPRYSQRLVDFLGSYVSLARQYGQRLLLAGDSGLVFAPSQDGAQGLAFDLDYNVVEHKGGLGGMSQGRTRQGQSSGQRRTDGFSLQAEHPSTDGEDRANGGISEHTGEKPRQFLQSLWRNARRWTGRLFSGSSGSYTASISESAIVSIERLSSKETYWDMQVVDTHNYVTKDGTIHHNSGKTVGACWETYFRCKAMPALKDGFRHSRWAFVRNTKEQLKDTTLKTWLEWFPDGVVGRYAVSDAIFYLEYEDIKAEILFRALDKPDDVRKLLSLELTGAFINEAREVPWAIVDGLTGRVGRYPRLADFEHVRPASVTEHPDTGLWQYPDGALWSPYWSGILMDTNPPDEDHWWFKKFEIQVHEDPQVAEKYRLFRQPPAVIKKDGRWATNPKAENLKNLKPSYYEDMVVGKNPEWIKVYAQGDYGIVSDGRPVHSGYNDSWNCREFPFDPRLPVYIGWDYSFRGQACVLAQLSKRGQLRVFDEFVGEETGIALEDFVFNAVKPGLAKYQMQVQASVGDPAGMKRGDLDERFALALLNDQYEEVQFKLPFLTEAADTNSLGPRLEGVDHYLNRTIDGAPAFLLHPRCSVLRKGFMGRYEYKRVQVVGDEKYKDVPNKNRYSHPQDALQYLIRGILMDSGFEEEEHERQEQKVGLSGY